MDLTSKRLKGIRGENFEAHIEYNKDLVAIHLPYVYKFNKSTYLEMKTMLKEWDDFFKTCGYKETYVAFPVNDARLIKLVDKLGFMFVINNQGHSIYKYVGE